MARIKRAVNKLKGRRKVMKLVKGFRAARRRNYRVANEALLHSLSYAFRDRRVRKRDFRALWISRINAAASFSSLDFMIGSISPPVDKTGWDAPVLVPGAIAATSPASSRKNPAEAARAPEGPVQTITGTGQRKMCSTISRVASIKPPGVLRRISNASACSRSA